MILTHKQLAAIDNMEDLIEHVQSPLQSLEHRLHGFVTYVVMPVFALTNAGVVFVNSSLADIFSSLSFNIEFSLIAGKLLGILLFSWIAVKTGLAVLPDKVKWINIAGLGLLGGMGFTMSLFIANLAFSDAMLLNSAKIGILVGSLIAGVAGYLVLRLTLKENDEN
jgi:NhaA family Na+:H+ antiporter